MFFLIRFSTILRMARTVTIPRTLLDELLIRISRLEKAVFKKAHVVQKEPTVQLSARAEKRYAKMEDDFRQGKNISTAYSVDELLKQLHDHSTS